ncbi:hypothetical protein Scep_003232 [Stephania cephalantha]|uniref:Kinesin-like protein n=1 Tax=Stephania cephalantha TaxID=152367 RepID=A0AAP0KQ42_9MAGN
MASMENSATPSNQRCPLSSKTPKSSFGGGVRVVARVRPFLPSEISEKSRDPVSCLHLLGPEDCSFSAEVAVHLKDHETSRNECYKLDSFFGQDSAASQIFEKEVRPLIPEIFRGCNATIFAYGATGSGKTHTMQGTDENPGLMPLAMATILAMCESTGSFAEVSYYEVYMDRCYDLLQAVAKEISVLDDKDGQVQLRGLSRVPVSSMSEFHEVLSCGIQRRKVAHTGLNDASSRSHGVLVIAVSAPSRDGSGHWLSGKLNLIDLAGNEDNRRTCNEGIRLQESAKINQSLFALSNVIYALNNNKPRVPYRESKLTRILQDSLGGNSLALMIACLNPGEYQESVNTVSLASRSRHISNYVSPAHKDTPKVKIDMEEKLLAWLESKGKTKSAHRVGTLGSPYPSKTPISTSTKKQNSYQQITRPKAIVDQGVATTKARNLFNTGAHIVSSVDDTSLFNEEHESLKNAMQYDGLKSWADESSEDHSDIPPDDRALNSCKVRLDELGEIKDDEAITKKTTILESTTNSANVAACSNECSKENTTSTRCTDSIESPSMRERIRAIQGSLRKVLSPINSNSKAKPFDDHPSKDRLCLVFFEPKTPKSPYVVTCDGDDLQATNTPFEKFSAKSSNLKSSLVQEYLTFLNSASKEELLHLKGIGKKRADSILQLRETSPIKSLYDLEKIGLSSKQVNDIFRKAAKGIFD